MDKNDSIDEFGLCSSSESVPKTLDKPVTWYGHRVMQTVLVILLLCYCTWRHKWLSLKKSWSWHIKVWENQYSETLFLYICWVEFILSIMLAFLLPCPRTTRKLPTAWSFAKHTWQPRDTVRLREKICCEIGIRGRSAREGIGDAESWCYWKKNTLQLGKCWLDVYGIPKWSQIEIQKVPKCPKFFQIASH